MAGILQSSGWVLTTDIGAAHSVVVHTCAFIADARRESQEMIENLARLKRRGVFQKLFVSGCLVQDCGTAFKAQFPMVDGYLGTGNLARIAEHLSGNYAATVGAPGGLLESSVPRLLSSTLPSTYVRIAEGCNHRCSFCMIPRLRGRYQSRSMASIITEAIELAHLGIREINLVAQDTTCYGTDARGKSQLSTLLQKLDRINGLRWIRMMYAYPSTLSTEVLSTIRDGQRLCHYIDIPLQHASDSVLRRMNRPGRVRQLLERITKIIPDVVLRTAFIVGFPGETEKEFKELCALVEEGWFEHVGVFEYSNVDGVLSQKLPGQVPSAVKRQRYQQLMAVQKKVLTQKLRHRRGQKVDVLVESVIPRTQQMKSRAWFQAPEIDNAVILPGTAPIGEFVQARITGQSGYDLTGEIIQ